MNDTKRGDNETDEEYFTRIARSYFRPTSVCDGDETDGVFLGEFYSTNATVAPDLNLEGLPQGKLKEDVKQRCLSIPVSEENIKKMKTAEKKVFEAIEGFGTEFQVKYSDETCNGVKVHSVKLEAISPPSGYPFQLPLVLLHGTGGGLACFYKQYRRLVQRCIVYAIDIPGFGLSSRLRFSGDIEACETQLKEIVEQWRVKMELDKMVLVGHSLGGYISAIYAIKHHERVARLILIDSWGIVPEREEVNAKSQGLLYNMATLFCDKMKANPLGYFSYLYPSMSAALVKWYTSPLKKFYDNFCMEYIHAINTGGEMSGMELLLILSDFKVDYAISPLKDRLLNRLRSVDLPLTFIYGEKSPYNNCGGEDVRKELKRLRNKDIVRVEEIKGCGHHVYAEEADVVSDIILEV